MSTSPQAAPPRRRRRRWVVALAVLLVLALAAGVMWYLLRPKSTAPASTQTTYTVATNTEQQTVSGNGTFAPATMKYATFASAGTVTTVDAVVGQKVTAGQRLASLDATALQQQVTVAQSNLTAAQAQLAQQQSSSATSAQIAATNAQIAADQAKLTQAQTAVSGATLTSPVAGTVAAVSLQTGDRVGGSSSGQSTSTAGAQSGSGQSGSGSGNSGSGSGYGSSSGGSGSSSSSSTSAPSESVTIIVPGSWVVNTTVDGSSIGQVKNGMQAQITPTTGNAMVFGTVSQVGVIGTTSGGVASFPVTVKVTGNPSNLYIGGTATVAIITRQLNDVLTVPSMALSQSGTQVTVQKLVAGKATTTPVSVGQTFGNQTQITKGLAAGDQIVFTSRVRQSSGTGGTGGSGRSGSGGFGTGGFGSGSFGSGGFGGGGYSRSGGGSGNGGSGTGGSGTGGSGTGTNR